MINKIKDTDRQKFNTLRFHMDFYHKVTQFVEINKMNSKNIAIVVGPNVFRQKLYDPNELFGVRKFYDMLEMMIDGREYFFDG